jgi:hypothetical protein
MKAPALTLKSQTWPRFDRYELVDGLIRPAPGAKLSRYDIGTVMADQPKNVARIYEELAPALSDIPGDGDGWPKRDLTHDEERAVLNWCAAHGLLGLLHHQVMMLVLAPRRRLTIDEDAGGEPELRYTPYQISYVRTGRGWEQTTRIHHSDGVVTDSEKDFTYERMGEDEVARATDIDDEIFESPKALVGNLNSPGLGVSSLREALGRFIPSIAIAESPARVWPRQFYRPPGRPPVATPTSWPTSVDPTDAFPCPPPDSDLFWLTYGEPVGEFVRAFLLLRMAMTFLQGGFSFNGPRLVDGLLAPVGLGVGKGIGPAPAEQLVAPTLLSAMAVAVGHAVADGRRVTPCLHCGRLLFTHKKLRRYCGPEHRRAAQNRRQRTKAKQKSRRKGSARRASRPEP